ncbi:MAG: TetR/AcrR family transcriptional regulator [Bradyrhizobium sp.]|nr:TetR/AcrR family transcriptional regulator [Bradyrhizobium sp.]
MTEPAVEPETTGDLYRIRGQWRSGADEVGLRERNKLEKVERITSAARRQFANKGYDGTTLRDIAKEAHVALGTLGFYAENKRDLVLLIFNETMPPILEKSKKAGVYEGSLVEALSKFFRPAFTAYAEKPDLHRTVLRENVFHSRSPHAREFHRIRTETIGLVRDLIQQARAAGEIRPYIDVELGARTVFFLFFAVVRWWLAAERPEVELGLTEFRSMCALLLDGMKRD